MIYQYQKSHIDLDQQPSGIYFCDFLRVCYEESPSRQAANVRAAKSYVRITPESGRVRRKPSRLLWANSGHHTAYPAAKRAWREDA